MPDKVFRDYDQEELDRQLNLRARWPEHVDHFERWHRESEAVRERSGTWRELVYGDSPGQRLDFFAAAEQDAPSPLLAFIHGGYWQSLDKADFDYLAPPFLQAGIAYASLNYDLAPVASIEEMVAQIRRCLAYLHRESQHLGLDPERLFVAGHSAGGHLATMAAATDWRNEPGSPPADLVKGAISISGVYELEPLRLSYHNEILHLNEDMARRMSPMELQPSAAAPILAVVGGEETDEFLRQQRDFAEAWRARGHQVNAVELPGLNHFTVVDRLGDPDSELYTRALDMLRGSRRAAGLNPQRGGVI